MKQRLLATIAAVGVASMAYAGDEMTSLSYISYLERYASILPARSQEAVDAVVNMPVVGGDRLDTARGARVEVQLADGATVWLDEFSTMDFDALAFSRDDPAPRTSLFLQEGTAAIEIPTAALGDGTLRLDSRAGVVFLNRPGLYRLDTRGSQLRVQTHSGFAELPVDVGSAILRAGQEAWLDGTEEIQKASFAEEYDDFWGWVQERRQPAAGSKTAQYVDSRAASRAVVLDSYGDWVYVDTFSAWMWRPHVNLTWVPYSNGRWHWTPVGWSWVSYEPWGWYPYHYGSWYFDISAGWVWGWDPVWATAWVHWIHFPGHIGWCPRGYYDWWYWQQGHRHHPEWGGGRFPARWSEATFDFSGRVRLRDIDPLPWTVIPAEQFTSSRLERVRIDPVRALRDGPGEIEGEIRSGPLVTSTPVRTGIERTLEPVFRETPARGPTPDLGDVFRRQPGATPETGRVVSRLQPVRTVDLTPLPSRPIAPGTGPVRGGAPGDVVGAPGIDEGSGRAPRGAIRSLPRRVPAEPPAAGSEEQSPRVRERMRTEPPARTSPEPRGSDNPPPVVRRPESPPERERPVPPPAASPSQPRGEERSLRVPLRRAEPQERPLREFVPRAEYSSRLRARAWSELSRATPRVQRSAPREGLTPRSFTYTPRFTSAAPAPRLSDHAPAPRVLSPHFAPRGSAPRSESAAPRSWSAPRSAPSAPQFRSSAPAPSAPRSAPAPRSRPQRD